MLCIRNKNLNQYCKVRYIVFILLFISTNICGQKMITGKIVDSDIKTPLSGATVSVIHAKDSILAAFAYSNEFGTYNLKLSPGDYKILCSYPGYADFTRDFKVDLNNEVALPVIEMTLKSKLLREVVIKAKPIAMKIIGDTTEYNASAYVIPKNSNIEHLLKQLPGIQVDISGRITAHGHTVRKILVDGEEFFNDDPTLVTRNLRGDMVDKIQIYDRKSDFSNLTGVDDDKKEKTINVKLKDDKKNGSFGKILAGYGVRKVLEAQGMYNRFKPMSKFAAYGNLANTGKIGLSNADNNRFGTTGGNVEFIAGGLLLSGVKHDELSSSSGRYNGIGLPEAATAGVHFDGRWNNGKESINLNAKTGNLVVEGTKSLLSENTLPEMILTSGSQQYFKTDIKRSRVDFNYQYKPSERSTFKITMDGLNRNSNQDNDYNASSKDNLGNTLNTTDRSVLDNADQQNLDVTLSYLRKFGKSGSSLSIVTGNSFNKLGGVNLLKASNSYQSNGSPVIDVIDQKKTNLMRQNVTNGSVTFSQPLSKSLVALIGYGLGYNASKTLIGTFDYDQAAGSYTQFAPQFSTDFKLKQLTNTFSLAVNFKKDKHVLDVSGKAALINFDQFETLSWQNYNRDFMTWNPQVSYRFQLPNGMLRLTYVGRNQLPTAEQLLPQQLNNDPLNIIQGNQTLRPAVINEANFSINFFNPKSFHNFILLSGFKITNNAIIMDISTDENGKSLIRPINLFDRQLTEANFRLTYGSKIKGVDITTTMTGSTNFSTFYGVNNGQVQKRLINNYSLGPNISQFTKKYNWMLTLLPFYTENKVQSSQNDNNRKGINGNLSFAIVLGKNTEVQTVADYQYLGGTKSFPESVEVLLWNVTFSRRILKSKSLKFDFTINDILNENRGFSQVTTGTLTSQTTYDAIKRYLMFSLTWDFNRFGTK